MTTPHEALSDITDLDCWREAREFVKLIFDLTGHDDFSLQTLLVNRLRQDCLEVMAKISEGYHSRQDSIFRERLEIAKGILGAAISHLYVAHDQNLLGHDELNDTLNKAYTVGIQINSALKNLPALSKKGSGVSKGATKDGI
jgi:four helix bundle protein